MKATIYFIKLLTTYSTYGVLTFYTTVDTVMYMSQLQ